MAQGLAFSGCGDMDIPKIKILTVDDHPLITEGIAIVISYQPDMDLVAQVATGMEAIERYRRDPPDVTLMDLRLPDMSGIDATMAIRAEFPQARIIMLSTFGGDMEVRRALEGGASGYLLKSLPADELLTVIRAVHAGRKRVQTELVAQIAERMGEERITTRETEVLEHVAAGRRNREIAELLYISEETVKTHLRHIVAKLGAKDRTHALAIANRRGILRF